MNRGLLNWGVLVIGSLLLAASLNCPNFFWLAFLGLALFLFALKNLPQRKIFRASWFFGFIFFSSNISWLFAIWPTQLSLPAEDNTFGLLMLLIVWFVLSAVVSLATALFGLGAKFFINRASIGWNFLLLPSAWVLSECLRALFFSIISWGPGGRIGFDWTFGDLGYVFTQTPLLFLSGIVGLYGLSWFAAFINVAIFYFLEKKFSKPVLIYAGAGAFAFLTIAFAGKYFMGNGNAPELKPLRVILLQTDSRAAAAPYERQFAEAYKKFVDAAGKSYEQPDVVVFPEDSFLFSDIGPEEKQILKTIFPDQTKPGLVITNSLVNDNGKKYDAAIYVDQSGKVSNGQPKNFLIPAGEFMPVALEGVLRFFGRGDLVEKFNSLRTITPGPDKVIMAQTAGVNIGVGVCSAMISPYMYQNLAAHGAGILINQTSLGLFHGQPTFLYQITQMARMHAVKTNRPILQAANTGKSMIIGAGGNILRSAPDLGNAIIEGEIAPESRLTLVDRVGEWVSEFSGAIIFLFFCLLLFEWRSKMKIIGNS